MFECRINVAAGKESSTHSGMCSVTCSANSEQPELWPLCSGSSWAWSRWTQLVFLITWP